MKNTISKILIFLGTLCFGFVLLSLIVLVAQRFVDINTIPFQKFLQAMQSILIFALPAVVCTLFFTKKRYEFLRLKAFSTRNFWLVCAFAFLAIPATSFIALLNEKVCLPKFLSGLEEWLLQMETELNVLTEQFLSVNSIGGLLVNLVVIALLAAVCEELFFRGFMQRIFEKIFKNYHAAIWLTAFIFSAIHFQFYGFFARMLLGAAFGYIAVFTGSLWLPILAHFINNAVGVLSYYFSQRYAQISNIDNASLDDLWLAAIACLLGSLLIISRIAHINRHAD
ncbi:MAG: CPBP family intramembrane metalloprotease [Prevotellaceae bacterium]|jgi:membrane protease YdiL (CAAX protease family)|nr:CPBP family intramembrane metalloprotease [Prevotellaceae bacterium]